MNAAFGIALADWRRLWRNPWLLWLLTLMPVAIVLLVVAAYRGGELPLTVGVVDLDGSPAAHDLVERIEARIQTRDVQDERELARLVRLDHMRAGIVIDPGYGEAVATGEPATIALVTDVLARSDASDLVPIVRSAVNEAASEILAIDFAMANSDANRDEVVNAVTRLATSTTSSVEGTTISGSGEAVVGRPAYTAISIAVLFIFLSRLVGSAAVVQMRQFGVLRRMLAAPVRSPSLVAGLMTTRVVLGGLQAVLIVVLSTWIYGLSWVDPLGGFLILAAFTIMAAGVGLVAGMWFRTSEQAASIGPIIGLILGLIGGCLWPLEIVTPGWQVAGWMTPHAWAVDGLLQAFEPGTTTIDVLPHVGVLVGFAVLTVGTGMLLFRRVETRP